MPDLNLQTSINDLASADSKVVQEAESKLLSNSKPAEPLLIQALNSEATASKAALLLGVMGARKSLPKLYELAQSDMKVEEQAKIIRAIAEIIDGREAFDEAAMNLFLELAQSKSNLIRGFSAKLFASMGGMTAQSTLKKMQNDEDPWVRQKASDALSGISS